MPAVVATIVVGSKRRVIGTYRDSNVALTDPSTVTIKTRNPAGTITTYTYPATVTKDSTGLYHVDVLFNVEGTWQARAESTGPDTGDEIAVVVQASDFQ